MVPILDLELGVVENKLTWQFYRKEMANFFVRMERSAMPKRQKHVSLVQEVVRILRNTKQDLPIDIRNSFVSEFSLRLKMSGYSENFRYEVISSAMTCYEKQLARAAGGPARCVTLKATKKKRGGNRQRNEVGANTSQLSCFAPLPPAASWQNSSGRWLKRKQITMVGMYR